MSTDQDDVSTMVAHPETLCENCSQLVRNLLDPELSRYSKFTLCSHAELMASADACSFCEAFHNTSVSAPEGHNMEDTNITWYYMDCDAKPRGLVLFALYDQEHQGTCSIWCLTAIADSQFQSE